MIIFILLTLLYAIFLLLNFSLVSVRQFRIQQAADEGNDSAKIADLLKDPEGYLSAVQVGITLVALVEGCMV